MGSRSKRSPYARGSKLVKSRTTQTRYGAKVEGIKQGSEYNRQDSVFTMRPVNSSNLDEVGYKRDTNTLRVLFKNGWLYDYFHVPETLHRQLINAGSKGKFLHQKIMKKYAYARVS